MHTQALLLKSDRPVTKSFANVFRCQVGKLVQNVFDRVAIGEIIEDQGDRNASALDDWLAVHDAVSTNDPCKSIGITVLFRRWCSFGHKLRLLLVILTF